MTLKFSAALAGLTAFALLAGFSADSDAAKRRSANDGMAVDTKAPGGTALGSATLWAVVNADGTVARSDGHLSAANLATGEYEVIFRRNIRNCAYIATIGGSGSVGTEPTGEITVIGRVSSVNGVFLTTHDSTGANANRGFHLFVNC